MLQAPGQCNETLRGPEIPGSPSHDGSVMQELARELEEARAALQQAAQEKQEAIEARQAAAQASAAAQELEQQVDKLTDDLAVQSRAIEDLERRCGRRLLILRAAPL